MTYVEKLQDPRWQRKRLEIFQRDDFKCLRCKSATTTLHIHHKKYMFCDPWDYPDTDLETLCKICHEITHKKIAPSKVEYLKEIGAIRENEQNFLTATQTHINILMNTLSKGVPSELEEEILKNIIYLQDKRKEYLNG